MIEKAAALDSPMATPDGDEFEDNPIACKACGEVFLSHLAC